MPDPIENPFRLRCMLNLTARFETIERVESDASPYAYNLAPDVDVGGRVFRGRAIFGENDPIPMLSILEDPRAFDMVHGPGGSEITDGDWPLIVQGFVDDDFENPTDPAHWLMADVKRVLAAARKESGNLLGQGAKAPMVDKIAFGAGVVRPPDNEVSTKAYFLLPVILSVVEDHENPFAA